MRKLVSIMLSVLLLAALVVPVSAEGTDTFKITASDTTVEVGQTVTLTISVEEVQKCGVFGVLVDFGDGFTLESLHSTGAGMNCPITINPGDVFLDDVAEMYGVGGWNYETTKLEDGTTSQPVTVAVDPETGSFGTIVLKATKVGTFTIEGVYSLITASGDIVDGTVDSVTITVTEATGGDVLLGDADGNGEVDNGDAMLILQYFVGLIEEDGLKLSACDVDHSGEVDNGDAMLVLQYFVGLIDSF